MVKKPLLFLGLLGFGLVGCNQQSASLAQPRTNVIAAGDPGSSLPDFTGKDLEGHQISSADLQGEVVLIDFWATWCQPCKKEMPGYQKLVDRYGQRDFAAVGLKLDVRRNTEHPVLSAKKIGVRYPLAVAADDLKRSFGGIEAIPTTLLYD